MTVGVCQGEAGISANPLTTDYFFDFVLDVAPIEEPSTTSGGQIQDSTNDDHNIDWNSPTSSYFIKSYGHL